VTLDGLEACFSAYIANTALCIASYADAL